MLQAEVDRKRRSCSGSRNGTPAAKGPARAPSPGDQRLDAQLDTALAAAAVAAAAGAPDQNPTPGSGAAPGGGAPALEPTEVLPGSAGQGSGGGAPAVTPASAAGVHQKTDCESCAHAAASQGRAQCALMRSLSRTFYVALPEGMERRDSPPAWRPGGCSASPCA